MQQEQCFRHAAKVVRHTLQMRIAAHVLSAPDCEHTRSCLRFFCLDPVLCSTRLWLARHAVELLDVAGMACTGGDLVRLGTGALNRQRVVDGVGHGVPVAGGGAGNGPARHRVDPHFIVHPVDGVVDGGAVGRDDAGGMIQLDRPGHRGFWALLVGIDGLAADDAFMDVGCEDGRAAA